MKKRTFVDAGVLIAAARGNDATAVKALRILDDPDREFVSSQFIMLEVAPKAAYNKNFLETEFYRNFFDSVELWADDLAEVVDQAYKKASQYGLSAMDSLHVAAAISTGSDELITLEKPAKPIHRVSEVRVVSIR
jgi:hypothetical protein